MALSRTQASPMAEEAGEEVMPPVPEVALDFEALVSAQRRGFEALARRLVWDAEEAKDVFQAAMTQAWAQRETFSRCLLYLPRPHALRSAATASHAARRAPRRRRLAACAAPPDRAVAGRDLRRDPSPGQVAIPLNDRHKIIKARCLF